MSLCKDNCDFVAYHKDENLLQCSCGLEYNIPLVSHIKNDEEDLFKFVDINSISNLKVMKCIHILFSKEGIKKNIGFYFFIPIISMYIICICIFYLNDFINIFVIQKIK